MAIAATESCNPCDNADSDKTWHAHKKGVMCGRRMYKGDFFCACTGEYVPNEVEAARASGRKTANARPASGQPKTA